MIKRSKVMKLKHFFISILIIGVIIGFVFIFFQKPIKPVKFESSELLSEVKPVAEGQVAQAAEEEDKEREEPKIRPEIVKSVYLTSWSASRASKINYVISLAKTTEINAVVIDIKDFSGYVAYDSQIPEVIHYGARRRKIYDIKGLIERLHQEGIYVIARVAVFQDPVLARARTDLAIYKKYGLSPFSSLFAAVSLWFDNLKLAWVDPASKEVWDYNIAIAREAAELGFDEINFDYVRFPSDGNLKNMGFPIWGEDRPRHQVIRDFFREIRAQLPDVILSIDLFGLTTTNYDDLGVGQIIEDAYENFDFICPMVYPSHYASGFRGYQNPAYYPYEVVNYSMNRARARLAIYRQLYDREEKKVTAQLRPWLQDFNLGAIYTPQMVRKEIDAVYDALGEDFKGFMLWNPSNIYTRGALKAE